MPNRLPIAAQAERQRQNAALTNHVHLVAMNRLAADRPHSSGRAVRTCDFEPSSNGMSNLEGLVRRADEATTIAPSSVPLLRPHIIAIDSSHQVQP